MLEALTAPVDTEGQGEREKGTAVSQRDARGREEHGVWVGEGEEATAQLPALHGLLSAHRTKLQGLLRRALCDFSPGASCLLVPMSPPV